jgi:hypothetical protein
MERDVPDKQWQRQGVRESAMLGLSDKEIAKYRFALIRVSTPDSGRGVQDVTLVAIPKTCTKL